MKIKPAPTAASRSGRVRMLLFAPCAQPRSTEIAGCRRVTARTTIFIPQALCGKMKELIKQQHKQASPQATAESATSAAVKILPTACIAATAELFSAKSPSRKPRDPRNAVIAARSMTTMRATAKTAELRCSVRADSFRKILICEIRELPPMK